MDSNAKLGSKSKMLLNEQKEKGPWPQLIIRGVTLINGNGAPPTGPARIIVVEQNKIVEIKTVGYPGVEIKDDKKTTIKGRWKRIRCLLACI